MIRLNAAVESFPTIMELFRGSTGYFEHHYKLPNQIDHGYDIKVTPLSLNILINKNISDRDMYHWSRLETCDYGPVKEGLDLFLRFILPVNDPRVNKYKAESLRFWNVTAASTACWKEYVGPRYVMVNMTNSCTRVMQEYEIKAGRLKENPFTEEDRQIESPETLFASERCINDHRPSTIEIIVHTLNGFTKIYCFGFKITPLAEVYRCSCYVFDIPAMEKFRIEAMVQRA